MEVTMTLCDAADQVGGKLYVLGGGWTHLFRPAQPVNMALGVIVAVPWDRTNERHPLTIHLLDEDGGQVTMGEQPVIAHAEVELGRPAGIKPGSSMNAVLAFTFSGLTLDVGGYVWALRVAEVEARTPFWVVERP